MSTIDRRSFLASSFALTGLAAAPEWLRRAMAPQDPQAPGLARQGDDPVAVWRESQLRAALDAAKAQGKPLLVLVLPEPRNGTLLLEWFSAWLTSTSPSDLGVIGVCTLACARVGEVVRVAGLKGDAIPAASGLQLLLLHGDAAKVTSITPDVPPIVRPHIDEKTTFEQVYQQVAKLRDAGVPKMTEAVIDGLDRHGLELAELARSVEQRLSDDDKRDLRAWLTTGKGAAPELLARATAWLRRELSSLPDTVQQQRGAVLMAAITSEVIRKQVPGSRWARPGGCGADYENPSAEEKKLHGMVACGMGSMPLIATRFLIFYSVGR